MAEENNTPQSNPPQPQPVQPTPPQQPTPTQPQQASPQQTPEVISPTTPSPTPPQNQTTPTSTNTTPTPPLPSQMKSNGKPIPPKTPPKKKNKNILTGCLSALGCGFILFIFLIVLGIQQVGVDSNPVTSLLGIDGATFVSIIATLLHFTFLIIVLTAFIATITGVFKAANARKDDKKAKNKGIIIFFISGLIFLISSVTWFSLYNYLESKRQSLSNQNIETGLITIPEDTTRLTAPVTIEFDATRIPFDSRRYQLLSVNWDFGDGSTGSGTKISHEYVRKGETGRYTVNLEVVKKDIRTGEEIIDPYTHEVTIENEQVNAIFTADPEEGPAPLEVEFDASESKDPDGQIVTWEWDFDDDGTYDEEGEIITHTFDQIGQYDVKLRVIDNNNEFSIYEKTITVNDLDKPQAVIESSSDDNKYIVNENYTFNGADSTSPAGNITQYSWDFGDGSPRVTNRSASHSFDETGKYTITLSVTDEEGNEAETELEIEVKASDTTPVAIISTTPTKQSDSDTFIEGEVPLTVSFNASQSTDNDNNIVDYEWDFESDGTTDQVGEATQFTYNQTGSFNATLKVIDAEGNEDTETITIVVKQQGIQANISASPTQGTVPLTVDFDASGSTYPSGQISSYEWDFGDGSPTRIDAAQVSYRYTQIGTFTATVTAIGNDNTRSTSEITISIRPVALKACYTPTRTDGDAPVTIIFDPRCSTGTISKYSWDFGDGQTSRERKPTHTFITPGTYTVSLEVSDNQNVLNTYQQTVTVN